MPPLEPILWLSFVAAEDHAGNITITTTGLTPDDVEQLGDRLNGQQRSQIVQALERAAIVLSGRQDTTVGVQLLERMLDDIRRTSGRAGADVADDLRRRLGLYRQPPDAELAHLRNA